MMKKMMVALLAALLVLSPLRAHAQESQTGGYPATIHAENPYAKGLQAAKTAYDDALKAYYAAAPRAYVNWSYYQAYVRAYYAVWSAYTQYSWYLQAYWWAERSTAFAGRVTAAGSRAALAGATVQLMNYVAPGMLRPVQLLGTRTTDANGGFRFDGLTAGTYSYSVEKAGYTAVRQNIEVRAGSALTQIELRRESRISGIVMARPLYGAMPVDPPPGWNDPRPLAGVKVSLYRTDVAYIQAPGPNAVVTTGADGRFTFPEANFSRANVVFEMSNYTSTTRDVTLGTGPVDLSVIMEWNGPMPPAAQGDAGFDGLNRR